MFIILNTATGAMTSAFWESSRGTNLGYIKNLLANCVLFASDLSIILGAQSTLDEQSNIFRYSYSSPTSYTRQWGIYTHLDNSFTVGRIYCMTFESTQTTLFMGGYHSFRINTSSFDNLMTISKITTSSGANPWTYAINVNQGS